MTAGSAPPPIDINSKEWELVRAILQEYVPDFDVWAFGSRARGTAKPYSDLDLAIIADKPIGIDRLAILADAFLESDLPWKVDVVDWASTDESFRRIIRRDRVILQKARGPNIQEP